MWIEANLSVYRVFLVVPDLYFVQLRKGDHVLRLRNKLHGGLDDLLTIVDVDQVVL